MMRFNLVHCLLILFLANFQTLLYTIFKHYFQTNGIPSNQKDVHFELSSTTKFSKLQVERLIRQLNLSPKNLLNRRVESWSSVLEPGLTEKRFRISELGDSSSIVKELGYHAGYYRLPRAKEARMFYFFIQSRNNKDDPVVIWLQGGPGCCSELAMLYENGPFHIAKNMSLISNDFGWDKVSNIIYVDQPVGTGFSYTADHSDIPHDENGVGNDLYDFLQAFFKEHPRYTKNDFFITGESYAGHYIPALASRIHKGNKAQEGHRINLKLLLPLLCCFAAAIVVYVF